MRVIVMLLLLVNLGFLAWQRWYGPDAEQAAPAGRTADNKAPRLLLVGEAPDAGQSAPAAASPAAAAPQDIAPAEPGTGVAPQTCSTVGPFEELAIAEAASSRLRTTGIRTVLRESGGQIRSGFWVYLPPFEDRSAAKMVEDELRGKDVQDLFIVTDSEQRNAISLGLFSSPERADQRAAEIGRLGYSPRVAERFRDAVVYWVDFIEPPGDPLEPESLGIMASGDTLPEKREISCDGIAAGANGA